MGGVTTMNNSQDEHHISLEKHEDADEFEYKDMELLERLETLREDMEDLKVTTLSELIQRIEELHRKLDNEQ
jgi:hypothetical protein